MFPLYASHLPYGKIPSDMSVVIIHPSFDEGISHLTPSPPLPQTQNSGGILLSGHFRYERPNYNQRVSQH